jgi:malonyl-CoA/methylmalonyl-CoA synthetase
VSEAAHSLLARLNAHPEGAVAVAGEPALSYGALAGEIAPLPVPPGSSVAFLVEPGAAYVRALVAIWRAGALAVPLSPVHPRAELEHAIAVAAPRLLLASRGLAPRLAEAAPGQPIASVEALAGGSGGIGSAGALPDPDGDALMLFTSGTTGRPKGVRLSHRALAATVEALHGAWRWRPDDRLLHVLPLHHTHGVVVALLGALWAGAEVRFAPFRAREVWEAFAGVTVFMAVPTMYAKLLEAYRDAPAGERARWSASARSLRLYTSGSAALPPALLEEFREATGQTILERYGMTEIGMALSNPYDGPRLPGAVGCELPGVTVDIVDEAGAPVGPGQPGELRVRTPQMFSGYHGDAAATAAGFDAQGRFRTGDTGTRDAGGVIRLLGRTSVDIIKSGGYKLSALEIEAALLEHPAVAEVAVVGLPDQTWGERVTACVVPRAPAVVTLEALQEFVRDRLAPYKLPRELRILDALPRNAMGKVQKQLLRFPVK